jgi:hypothetical protein
MSWDDAFDRMLQQRERSGIAIRTGMSLAAAVVASMETAAAMAKVMRDVSHPRYVGKEQPRSPRQSFRKSSKR